MSAQDVQVGDLPVTVVRPEGLGPWPAVVLYADAGGVRPPITEIAQRVADGGYLVAVPDLYWRERPFPPFDVATVFDDPDERARLMALVATETPERAVEDTGTLLDWLGQQPDVRGTAVGCTGYCMGGGLALRAAAAFPDRVAAAASFHGGRLATDTPDSPHLLLPQVRARLYVGVARDDASFPPEQQERLEGAVAAAGLEATVEPYDAAHGFAVPDNPTYDPAAAARHVAALRDLLARAL